MQRHNVARLRTLLMLRRMSGSLSIFYPNEEQIIAKNKTSVGVSTELLQWQAVASTVRLLVIAVLDHVLILIGERMSENRNT